MVLWFGVQKSTLPLVLPNISRFYSTSGSIHRWVSCFETDKNKGVLELIWWVIVLGCHRWFCLRDCSQNGYMDQDPLLEMG